MPSATPQNKLTFATGYPAALNDLQTVTKQIEPDLIFGLYALLTAAGVSIDYCEADVISGHAAQFLYSREHPECTQLAFSPPTDTLFRALSVAWKEITPSGVDAAFAVWRDHISSGEICLARLNEPLLVYGFSENRVGANIAVARIWRRLTPEIITLSECESRFWRYPVDEGNLLLFIEEIPPRIPEIKDVIVPITRRTARAWFSTDLAGCATGEAAYLKFAADLKDPLVDFSAGPTSQWMGTALWRQWTARRSLYRFYERVAPRFGGAERQIITKAAFDYGQCVESWQKWANLLGPTWDISRNGFPNDYPDEFVKRWHNMALRTQASHWIDEARIWEEKAVSELTRLIH
ncbi:MAG: hypothetical protein ACOZB3_00810 [Calditrichota bacterium]